MPAANATKGMRRGRSEGTAAAGRRAGGEGTPMSSGSIAVGGGGDEVVGTRIDSVDVGRSGRAAAPRGEEGRHGYNNSRSCWEGAELLLELVAGGTVLRLGLVRRRGG